MPLSDLIDEVVRVTKTPAKIVWVDEQDILNADITPWGEMPLMRPAVPEFRYFLDVSTARAQAVGLTCRPLQETLAPLLAWDRGRRDQRLKCGLSSEQEHVLLR